MYHDGNLDLGEDLPLFEESLSDEEDYVDKIDSEPDEIEGQVADQTDNEDSSEDSSSMPTFVSKDGTVWYKQPIKRTKSLILW